MVDDGTRIVGAEPYAGRVQSGRRCFPGSVQEVLRGPRKLGHPTPQILPRASRRPQVDSRSGRVASFAARRDRPARACGRTRFAGWCRHVGVVKEEMVAELTPTELPEKGVRARPANERLEGGRNLPGSDLPEVQMGRQPAGARRAGKVVILVVAPETLGEKGIERLACACFSGLPRRAETRCPVGDAAAQPPVVDLLTPYVAARRSRAKDSRSATIRPASRYGWLLGSARKPARGRLRAGPLARASVNRARAERGGAGRPRPACFVLQPPSCFGGGLRALLGVGFADRD